MKTQDLFGSFYDPQDSRLNKLGDPLARLGEVVDWEPFRPLLERVRPTERKSNAGAPRRDEVLMFKGLVIQHLYGLSDEQLEYQIEDRRSFQRFMGLDSYRRAPDAKTFWAFREQLVQLGLTEALFEQFAGQLEALGYRARKGQMVDATLVPAPVQRNTREENACIKEGKTPAGWEDKENRHRVAQKDTEARWTKKHGKSHYGYKNHVNVDNKHKLVRKYDVSAANVHDSQVLDDLLDENNTSKDVWADSAYRSREQEERLRAKQYRSHIQRKGSRNRPLTERERQGNRSRAKIRVRVEHVFGAQCATRAKLVRCIGLKRSALAIGMMNLVYNMRRLCYLQGVSAPA